MTGSVRGALVRWTDVGGSGICLGPSTVAESEGVTLRKEGSGGTITFLRSDVVCLFNEGPGVSGGHALGFVSAELGVGLRVPTFLQSTGGSGRCDRCLRGGVRDLERS